MGLTSPFSFDDDSKMEDSLKLLEQKDSANKITNPSNIFNSYKVADTIDPHSVIFFTNSYYMKTKSTLKMISPSFL